MKGESYSNVFGSGTMHRPMPRKKMPMHHVKHIARTPMKTGMSTSGGGTTRSGGMVKTTGGGTYTGPSRAKGRRKGNFSMPRPDKYGYY